MIRISTNDLAAFINKQKGIVIDVRSVDAYNGWRMQNEVRGGHIKGAKSLPLKWTNYIDWIEIVRSKSIQPENTLVIYGYTAVEDEKAARFFQNAGYKNIYIYTDFVDEWVANAELPMDHLARYKNLVSAQWVKSVITGDKT